MAIPDAGKQFEANWIGYDPVTAAFTAPIKAGALIVVYMGGKRSAAALSVSNITDSKGNTYQVRQISSTTQFAAIAWTRTTQPMGTSDWIRFDMSGGPSYAWASCHVFEGADDTATDIDSATGFGDSISRTMTVAGSDWLTVAVLMFPNDYGMTLTPLNSSISQDDNANASSSPWIEAYSRNGTTGATHTIGATAIDDVTYSIVAVSFPSQALPAGRGSARILWF
jgi:hypothetical protein